MRRTRREPRFECNLDARLTLQGGSTVCRVLNISRSGLAVERCPIAKFQPGARVHLAVDRLGSIRGTVRWAGMQDFGVEFDTPLTDSNLRDVLGENARALEEV